MAAAAADADVHVLEEGEIGLFYRPRVETEHVRSLADVQRLLVVLAPHGRRTHRLLSIGRKRLPDPSERGRERFWGIVGRVGGASRTPRGAFPQEPPRSGGPGLVFRNAPASPTRLAARLTLRARAKQVTVSGPRDPM
jgi:hypothetical protein